MDPTDTKINGEGRGIEHSSDYVCFNTRLIDPVGSWNKGIICDGVAHPIPIVIKGIQLHTYMTNM